MALILIGCSHAKYYKEGATQQDWYKSKTDCLVKARQAGYVATNNIFDNNYQPFQGFFQECLAGEGWAKKSEDPKR